MIRLIRKLRRRSRVELAMLAAALVLRVCALALVRVVRFGRLQKWAGTAARACSRRAANDPDRDRVVGWAVATAAMVLPVRNSCLHDALAAQWLLAACGRRSTICFGVVQDGVRAFGAHAWVESHGAIIVGGANARTLPVLE
jgi:hypothetical protein